MRLIGRWRSAAPAAPGGAQCASALLCLINPEPQIAWTCCLAVAARVACTIYWRWPEREDSVRFVSHVLSFAHKEGKPPPMHGSTGFNDWNTPNIKHP